MTKTICIAGKNNIAIEIARYIEKNFLQHKLIAITNRNDHGENSFQLSFRAYCELHNISITTLEEVYQIPNLIFLSLEFDRIIKPEKFLSKQLYNIHFSYLPAYKGMYTSALPILHNEKYSGVSLHKIDRGIDTGDIIDQIKFEIGFNTTGQELYKKYIKYGTAIVKENLNDLIYNEIGGSSQSIYNASYYGKDAIDYTNLKIDLKQTALQVYNQIRAFAFPAYQLPLVDGHRIYHSKIQEEKSQKKPGSLLFEDDFELKYATIDYNISLLKDRRSELFDACKIGDIDFITYLKEHAYDINQKSNEGWDALIIAAYHGQTQLVKWLIEEQEWDIHTQNNNLTNFAMYVMTEASKNNHLETLKYVINHNIPVNWNHVDTYGKNLLHYAKQLNNQNVLDLLPCK